ncbi:MULTISPECIES: hypothetical protein [unclassified Xanthomonas]|uniref:hypothetical protein n=1 Tax=unclassified Xanthomonas TaxID=2643310 RepID=UPI002A837FED|nr:MULTISPECIES: hypothetical protein [unclassified Xanthomonas]MDY4297525.1 hypothetical protein [Xanthomonas sp. LF02-5]MDY4359319.1 hypothetical protein [Xanthomonas sp. LF04-12]
MTQTSILDPTTTTPSTSTAVTPAAGSMSKIGLYVASGALPDNVRAEVVMGTPGSDLIIGTLHKGEPTMLVPGPATGAGVRVRLTTTGGTAVGVFKDE